MGGVIGEIAGIQRLVSLDRRHGSAKFSTEAVDNFVENPTPNAMNR